MTGIELRRRLDRLGRSYTELAPLLGLSITGLHKQMRGERAVSRQTELLLEQLELRGQTKAVLEQLKATASTGRGRWR
jgi:hypothetical protein